MTDREQLFADVMRMLKSDKYVTANHLVSSMIDRVLQAARTGGEVEPIGWVWESYNQTNFTAGSHHKELLESDGVQLTPVYTHPAPVAAVPDDATKADAPAHMWDESDRNSWALGYNDALSDVRDTLTTTPQPVGESEKEKALQVLRDNVRAHNGDVRFLGLHDNDVVRDALHVLLSAQPPEGESETDYKALYQQLLGAVETKFFGETRHQTALKYICNAERGWDRATIKQAQPPEGEHK